MQCRCTAYMLYNHCCQGHAEYAYNWGQSALVACYFLGIDTLDLGGG